ncbi:NACHT domain-containing protein [Microcoleus sp. FACHB-831]|uniref:NACHT domain-containing protein n=1 Tax=Microcoleus sp. FACHB-831 TaxID=2692827 RepID=UPI0016892171|nr:NACHT domain-containing protein [Microcoleus sp. FACHB-831]MBD1919766.1 NACHT domain-containing protein [Microcoleus sp. FACHB-831]
MNKSKTTSIDFKGYLNRPCREQVLLQAVKDEVEVRIQSSLHNVALINLGKPVQLERIERLWDVEIKTGGSQFELVTSKTSILEIFERMDVAGKLLIRGKTGSGKTTTMLNLAKEMIRRAEADINYPIPVLFDLCSWKNSHQPMTDWLVDELKLKYGVRKNLGKQLLDNKQLLPLLDGLDEVEPSLHESCVRELNAWLQGTTQPLYLIVCSLWGDIQDSPQPDIWQLSLNAVVQLKPLTQEQIQQYLISVDCTELCQMLEPDTNLLELVRTPFLLNITAMSYELLSLAQWQHLSSRAQRVEYLLDAYVQYMLHREIQNRWYGKHKTPSVEQTRRWLVYLAQQLQKECRTEFLVGKTPIYWVPTGKNSYEYSFFVLLITWLISFISFGIISWLIFQMSPQLILWLIVGIILYFILLLEGNLVEKFLKTGIVISSCIAWCYLQIGAWLDDWLKPLGKQVHHFIPRLIFIPDRHIHWNYNRFLDYCTERLFLQRAGRRYRFIHKLLEDYFSRMSC